MKEFESYKFNLVTYKEELEAFKQLLTKPNLEESKDILPFFKEKKTFSSSNRYFSARYANT